MKTNNLFNSSRNSFFASESGAVNNGDLKIEDFLSPEMKKNG